MGSTVSVAGVSSSIQTLTDEQGSYVFHGGNFPSGRPLRRVFEWRGRSPESHARFRSGRSDTLDQRSAKSAASHFAPEFPLPFAAIAWIQDYLLASTTPDFDSSALTRMPLPPSMLLPVWS